MRGLAWGGDPAGHWFCRTKSHSHLLSTRLHTFPHTSGPTPRRQGAGLPARQQRRVHQPLAPRLPQPPLRPLCAALHRGGQRPKDARPGDLLAGGGCCCCDVRFIVEPCAAGGWLIAVVGTRFEETDGGHTCCPLLALSGPKHSC